MISSKGTSKRFEPAALVSLGDLYCQALLAKLH